MLTLAVIATSLTTRRYVVINRWLQVNQIREADFIHFEIVHQLQLEDQALHADQAVSPLATLIKTSMLANSLAASSHQVDLSTSNGPDLQQGVIKRSFVYVPCFIIKNFEKWMLNSWMVKCWLDYSQQLTSYVLIVKLNC